MTRLLIILCTCVKFYLFLGKIWNNVWGKESDEYSRRVIRDYLCSQEIEAKKKSGKKEQLHIVAIAALHRGGQNFRSKENRKFGSMVAKLITSCKFMIYCILIVSAYKHE